MYQRARSQPLCTRGRPERWWLALRSHPDRRSAASNFTQIRNSVRFNFIPVGKDDHGAACAVFDAFDEAVRTGRLANADSFVEAHIDPAFSADALTLYKKLGEGHRERTRGMDLWLAL